MVNVIQTIAVALEAKQRLLLTHSIKTAKIAAAIAERVELPEDITVEDVMYAGMLHDIGKLFIHDTILNKNEGLTPRELEIIQEHPLHGYSMALEIDSLQKFAVFILQHHEKADGTGYPRGIGLDKIHPVSRIVCIADKFAALTEDRPYRKALQIPEIVIEMLTPEICEFFPGEREKVQLALLEGHPKSTYVSQAISTITNCSPKGTASLDQLTCGGDLCKHSKRH